MDKVVGLLDYIELKTSFSFLDLRNKYEAELSELKTMKNKELNQLKDAHEEELLGLKGKLSVSHKSKLTKERYERYVATCQNYVTYYMQLAMLRAFEIVD